MTQPEKPDTDVASLFQQGLHSHQAGKLSEAHRLYSSVLEKQPGHFDALHMLGVIFLQSGNPAAAEPLISRATSIHPDNADAHYNRGLALHNLRRLDDALSSYERAIAINPGYAQAHFNRSNALKELWRLNEALASYDRTVAIKPDHAVAFNNRGNTLKDLKRLEEALASYEKAIALKPDYVDAFYNRGVVLKDLKRLDEALANYEKALAIKPDCDFLPGLKLHTQMHFCDWSDLAAQMDALKRSIQAGQKASTPSALLGLVDDPELQLKAARIFALGTQPANKAGIEFRRKRISRPLRIGYYSADFHNHATAYLMAELFESHDAGLFETYGFSFGPDTQDRMRKRLSGQFKEFHDVTRVSDQDVARLSRKLEIDIALDLKGYTQDARTGIFAERCAPIQVNYLGYPGTMGSPHIDYIIADKTLIPQESRIHFTEKVVYMPHSYQVNDSKRAISDDAPSRAEAGLPEAAFVFCCFNNNYKILPATFASWMRMLQAVRESVLWLLEDNPLAASNLRKHAQAAGVDPARLVFAPRLELSDHLARHRLADLFLDTLPCNAHTTASDALWAGLPVLTLIGESFAARVAASLLDALSLPALITQSPAEYEARAIELATHPAQLRSIRQTLEGKRSTSTLFDGVAFTRHLEAAYLAMFERWQSGLQPDHIIVEP